MINSDKLKEAHELAALLAKQIGKHVELLFSFYPLEEDECSYTIYNLDDSYDGKDCLSICTLISRLKKLTKPEPKYKVGDFVYVKDEHDNVHYVEIKNVVSHHDEGWIYRVIIPDEETGIVSEYGFWDNQIYPSRKSLIDAQIEYWTCLNNGEMSTSNELHEQKNDGCVHEPYMKMPTLNDGGIVQKCKKCGDFYR